MSLYREENRIDLGRLRRERLEKARAQMEKEGIGAYLCFDAANIGYLTDTYTYRLEPLLARNILFPRTGDPILYEWGFRWQGARIEDLVVVTKDGYEDLAMWPKNRITECWI